MKEDQSHMHGQCHPHAKRQLFVLATALLLCLSTAHSVSGQEPNLRPTARPYRAPDPPIYLKHIASKRPDNRAKRTTQQATEQAIAKGNQSRGRNEYKQALNHYQQAQALNPKEARAFYGMGNLYFDLYCHGSAIEAYHRALALNKNYLEARIGLGYVYIGKETYDDAREQFQEVLNIKPQNIEANLGLGMVHSKKGMYEDAIKQINLVINDKSIKDKDRALAHVALGDVYRKQDKWQEVIKQYEKAISLDPTLAGAYISLGSVQMTAAFAEFAFISPQDIKVQDREKLAVAARQATDNIEKAMHVYGYNRPDAYLSLGFSLMHQARYRDAVSKINTYLTKVREVEKQLSSLDQNIATKCDYGFSRLIAEGYWHLGFVYLEESLLETNNQQKTKLLSEAGEHFKQAIKLREDYALAYRLLGLVYSEQGNYEEAIEQYNKAILYTKDESSKARLHQSISQTYRQKGRDHGKQGKHEEAIEQYKKAILEATEEPDRARIYEDIALAYSDLGHDANAISNLQEAIKRDPNNPSFYESLAIIYVKQGSLEETFKWLKKADAVRKTPSTNPNPYYFLGTTYAIRYLQKGNEEDFNEAIKWLNKAVEIRHDFIAVYHVLGTAYRAHSNPDEAIANYEKAVRYAPKDANTYLILGQGYFELKKNDEAAIQYLKQAIGLKPDYAEAYWRLGLVYHHKKDDTEAIKQILEAIKYAPKDLQAYLALASIYKDQKNYTEAIKQLNKASGIAPKDFRPYKELAKLYEEQQKNEDAVRYYKEALNLLNDNYAWAKNMYLGRIARLQGSYDEAISYFRKLPQPPTEIPGQALYDIGLTYVASKNKKSALEQYQQLVQLKSSLADELLEKIKAMK